MLAASLRCAVCVEGSLSLSVCSVHTSTFNRRLRTGKRERGGKEAALNGRWWLPGEEEKEEEEDEEEEEKEEEEEERKRNAGASCFHG